MGLYIDIMDENDNFDKIQKIISSDIVANTNAMDTNIMDDNNETEITEHTETMEWLNDANFFTQFDWLTGENVSSSEKMALLLHWCEVFGGDSLTEAANTKEEMKNIYLYYVALEDDNMFLHADFYMESDAVIAKCADKYDFVKQHRPIKVVYNMIVTDLHSINAHVKMFVYMFGMDTVRGGSYTDVELSDETKNFIMLEKPITQIEYFSA